MLLRNWDRQYGGKSIVNLEKNDSPVKRNTCGCHFGENHNPWFPCRLGNVRNLGAMEGEGNTTQKHYGIRQGILLPFFTNAFWERLEKTHAEQESEEGFLRCPCVLGNF